MVRHNHTTVDALSGDQRQTNRFVQVLEAASKRKAGNEPLKRPSLAEEFFRENPMPWLLDSDPVQEPSKDSRRSA